MWHLTCKSRSSPADAIRISRGLSLKAKNVPGMKYSSLGSHDCWKGLPLPMRKLSTPLVSQMAVARDDCRFSDPEKEREMDGRFLYEETRKQCEACVFWSFMTHYKQKWCQ